MSAELSMPFGALLRRYREVAGLSQEDLAERAGLTAKGIGALERGERQRPQPRTLQRLAAALELSDRERAAFIAAVLRRAGTGSDPEAAPAAPSAPGVHALPVPLTPLIGRDRDLATVTALLQRGDVLRGEWLSPVQPLARPALQVETKYANSDGVRIAYQVVGNGPIDLVFAMGWVSNMELFWQEPRVARFLKRLASFARVMVFDKRGTGLSDRDVGLPGLEQRIDDVRAVMDAAGSERAALLGVSEAGAMCTLFAATHPEMTSALILVGCVPRRVWAPDYPWGATVEERERRVEQIHHIWGSAEAAGRDLGQRAPSVAHDPWVRDWWSTYLRMSASPSSATALIRMNNEVDVRPVLPTLRVPTLIIHRVGDRTAHVEMGRYMASQIPGARYVELPGDDHLPFFGDQDAILDEVEQYLTGVSHAPEPRRALLTLLAVDVVGPLDTAATFDDRQWQTLLETFHLAAGRELTRFRAEEIEVTGGRVLAASDGPVRAITCAHGILDALHSLGLEGRAGVHAGECEYTPKGIQGLAVHIAGRVMAFAAPGTVVISGIVRGLIAGSPLHIDDLGVRLQGGIPGGQRLYRVSHGMEPPPDRPRETDFSHQAVRLSPREREVVALVARGRTNREIGEELGIAESTAERHVINVLNKLGQHSRTQIAAWAVAQGLTTGDVD